MLEDGRLEPFLREAMIERQKEEASRSGRWARDEAGRVEASRQQFARELYKEASRR